MNIGNVIAQNLKKIREERNLSQGQLAEMAGLSKVVISQIEKGDSNPTINTIWKLTGALNLPYTSLLEPNSQKTLHVKRKDVSQLDEDKYHVLSYYPKSAERNFEVYQVVMENGCDHLSIGHSSRSYEYLMLTEGKISVVVGEKEYVLEEDDGLFFDAFVPHRYINREGKTAKMVMIVQYLP